MRVTIRWYFALVTMSALVFAMTALATSVWGERPSSTNGVTIDFLMGFSVWGWVGALAGVVAAFQKESTLRRCILLLLVPAIAAGIVSVATSEIAGRAIAVHLTGLSAILLTWRARL